MTRSLRSLYVSLMNWQLSVDFISGFRYRDLIFHGRRQQGKSLCALLDT